MTLTEEQRAALKRVIAYMNRMYGIASPYYGCTEDANILRAMIDSSDHIRESPKMVGFDLEENRAAIDSAINSLLCEGWDNEASTVRRLVAEIERLRGDAKPRVWQITEDRITAIDQGLRFLEWSNAKTGHVETKKRIAILKTMLEEASDEHGFER